MKSTEESAKEAFELQSAGWVGAPSWEDLAEESKVFWRDYVMSRDNHPWAKFLEVRLEAIRWMNNEGKSPGEIQVQLSMDFIQTNLLIATTEQQNDERDRQP